MAGHDRLQHRLLGQFLGFGLNHQDRVGCTGDDKVQNGILHLLDRRIEPHFALDDANARGADRAHERHAGQGQRRRGGDQRQDVRIQFEIIGEDGRDDLRLAAESVGKQRTDRPVDQARRQRLSIRRPPLALQIAAGNPAGGEGLFLIVDGEGEEVLPGLGLLRRDDSREHRRFSPGGEHGAVRLASHAAGFKDELAPAPVEFFTLNVKHLSSSCG